jgi:hypothetical protein
MKTRTVISVLCRSIAAVGSLLVSAYGAYCFDGADFRRDALAMSLFCILPALSFPVFLFSFWSLRWSVATHWILAAGYLAVYSLLDWRTCSELGTCHSLLQVVLLTLTAGPVEAPFAVAAFNLAALLLRSKKRPALDDRAAAHPGR